MQYSDVTGKDTDTYPANHSTIETRQMCSIIHNLLLNNPAQTASMYICSSHNTARNCLMKPNQFIIAICFY